MQSKVAIHTPSAAYIHDPNSVGHHYMHNTLLTLHRDISYNNILLHPSGFSGFLIDFDLAIYISRQTNSGSSHRTGTYDFMAIDILLGRSPHTALHDLESFFYVLLWMCIYFTPSLGRRFPKPKVPIFPSIRANEQGLTQAATSKIGCMHPRGFLTIWDSLTMDTKEKLGNTLLDWMKIMFPPQTEVNMNPVSIVEEDGHVERKYEEVLALL
jgi:serine/threonine protein kinase